jgi:hypothetical protein
LDNENNNNNSTFQSKLLCFKATVRVSLSHSFVFKETTVSLFYLICPAVLPDLSPLLSAGMLLLSLRKKGNENPLDTKQQEGENKACTMKITGSVLFARTAAFTASSIRIDNLCFSKYSWTDIFLSFFFCFSPSLYCYHSKRNQPQSLQISTARS